MMRRRMVTGLLGGALVMALLASGLPAAADPAPGASHAAPAGADPARFPVTAANADIRLTLSASPATARVGELATLSGEVTDARTGKPVPGARITLRLHHIEDDTEMLAAEFIAPEGRFTWKHHFFDGAEHQVIVGVDPSELSPRFAPLEQQFVMEVEPVDPPVSVRFKGLAVLLAATAAGLWAGYWLAWRGGRRKRLASAA